MHKKSKKNVATRLGMRPVHLYCVVESYDLSYCSRSVFTSNLKHSLLEQTLESLYLKIYCMDTYCHFSLFVFCVFFNILRFGFHYKRSLGLAGSVHLLLLLSYYLLLQIND